MRSYLIYNDIIFELIFFDSLTRFDEDFEHTKRTFSRNTINKSSFEELMFTLHVRINMLKPLIDNPEAVLSNYSLAGYGNGPQYDNDNLYYIPSGTFNLVSSETNFFELRSLDFSCRLIISCDELEYFTDQVVEDVRVQGFIEIDNWFSTPIFIRSDGKDKLIKKLLLNIKQLNNLYRDFGMTDKIIEFNE